MQKYRQAMALRHSQLGLIQPLLMAAGLVGFQRWHKVIQTDFTQSNKTRIIQTQLDFLLQEMNREINTIGSKVEGTRGTALVIDAKAELERIREQAQNVE